MPVSVNGSPRAQLREERGALQQVHQFSLHPGTEVPDVVLVEPPAAQPRPAE